MGRVFKCLDPDLGRYVAIKVLHERFAGDGNSLQRFEKEARAVARLDHENIVKIYDFNQSDDERYIVMEFVDGPPLNAVIGDGLPEAVALRYAAQVSSALAHAHRKGILHRDIKPGNVLIRTDDVVKLTDFGIVRFLSDSKTAPSSTVLGTPEYMSPEQHQGRDLDERSDLYSLGVVLYQMLAGRLPFEGRTAYEVGDLHVTAAPPKIERISPSTAETVMRLLMKEPHQRFDSATTLEAALRTSIHALETAAATIDRSLAPTVRTSVTDTEDRQSLTDDPAGESVALASAMAGTIHPSLPPTRPAREADTADREPVTDDRTTKTTPQADDTAGASDPSLPPTVRNSATNTADRQPVADDGTAERMPLGAAMTGMIDPSLPPKARSGVTDMADEEPVSGDGSLAPTVRDSATDTVAQEPITHDPTAERIALASAMETAHPDLPAAAGLRWLREPRPVLRLSLLGLAAFVAVIVIGFGIFRLRRESPSTVASRSGVVAGPNSPTTRKVSESRASPYAPVRVQDRIANGRTVAPAAEPLLGSSRGPLLSASPTNARVTRNISSASVRPVLTAKGNSAKPLARNSQPAASPVGKTSRPNGHNPTHATTTHKSGPVHKVIAASTLETRQSPPKVAPDFELLNREQLERLSSWDTTDTEYVEKHHIFVSLQTTPCEFRYSVRWYNPQGSVRRTTWIGAFSKIQVVGIATYGKADWFYRNEIDGPAKAFGDEDPSFGYSLVFRYRTEASARAAAASLQRIIKACSAGDS
jgi:serine/threonine protein kinase